MYKTFSQSSTAEYTERGSKFLGYAYPCTSESKAKEILSQLQAEHPKATHICWAYRLGDDGQNERSWDDGEPSGTAGLPILNQIKSSDCTYAIVLVVRYYGGKKLGAAGLKTAYKTAASQAIVANEIVSQEPQVTLSIESKYQNMHRVMSLLKKYDAQILEQNIDNKSTWLVQIPKKEQNFFTEKLAKFSTFTLCDL